MALHWSCPVFKRLELLNIKRLEQYLATSKVEDADQQRAILLSICGPATYRLIHNLLSPKTPTELNFKDIMDLLTKHHDSKPSVIVQRYRFNTRNRHSGESISTYVTELHHLSEYYCNFENFIKQGAVCLDSMWN